MGYNQLWMFFLLWKNICVKNVSKENKKKWPEFYYKNEKADEDTQKTRSNKRKKEVNLFDD